MHTRPFMLGHLLGRADQQRNPSTTARVYSPGGGEVGDQIRQLGQEWRASVVESHLASRKRDRSIITASHVFCFNVNSTAENLRLMTRIT